MSTNPLLTKSRMPGAKFQLPSQGQFYTNGELDSHVKNGEVHVYPMTAYDEILLKTPDLLLSGEAIQKVFKRCIPEVLDPLNLFNGDIDFLTVCLRSVSFGSVVDITHNHHCSESAIPHSYSITIDDFVQRTKMIDPTTLMQQYTCKMPNGFVVHFTPIRYNALIDMMNADTNEKLTPEQIHDKSSSQLASLVSKIVIPPNKDEPSSSTEVVTNKEMIIEWIQSLAIGDIRIMNATMDSMADWGTNMNYNVTCKDCNQPISIRIPLNPISFFM
jgi:hypothetical protein